MDIDSSTNSIAVTATIATIVSATVAIILQSDTKLGRSSYIITAEQLVQKRIQQYIYFWQQSLYRIEEYINYNYCTTCTGSIGTGSSSTSTSGTSSGITEEPDYRIEQNTDYIVSTVVECTSFVTEFLLSKDTNNENIVYIGRIGTDRSIAKRNSTTTTSVSYDTIFVWFYVINSNTNSNTIYQISLEMITSTIATIMECQYIFTGTFCFIADASCSVVSDFICNVVDTAFNNTNSNTGNNNDTTCIEFLQQPYWMLCYSVLVQQIQQQQSLISVDDNNMLQKLIYTLIRIEAIRLSKKDRTKRISTIIVTIPSSINTIILPLLVQAFPSDRHIFAYTNGISTVSLSLQSLKHNQQQQSTTATNFINSISQSISSMLPTNTGNGTSTTPAATSTSTATATATYVQTLEDTLSLHTFRSKSLLIKNLHKKDIQTIRTIPMNVNYLYKQSQYIIIKKFILSLTNVPTTIASILDIWLSSIDIFFTLKNLYCDEVKLQQKLIKQQAHIVSSSKKSKSKAKQQYDIISTTGFNYVPYVFKFDFLVNTARASKINSNSNSNTNDEWEYGTDKYWSLRSLLQYVTGKQNRELSNECMMNSIQYIQKYQKNLQQQYQQQQQSNDVINNGTKKYIENIIFQHKLVLIADKTLQDTVLPAQHWVLINTNGNKSGCACCGPEDDDDDDDTDDEVDDYDYDTNDDNTKENEALVNNSDKKKQLMTSKSIDTVPVVVEQQQQQQQKQLYIDGRMGFAFDPNRFS